MKLETIKGYNLTLNPFLMKILDLQILAIFVDFWSKNGLFCILFKIGAFFQLSPIYYVRTATKLLFTTIKTMEYYINGEDSVVVYLR